MARGRHESAVKSQTSIAHQQQFERMRSLENKLEIPILILAFAWLGLLVALYAFAVFGYVKATLASFFVDRDTQNVKVVPVEAKQLAELPDQFIALREEIRALSRRQ